ncbi:class I SAM-dependent methyltransferase [Aspergillus undulatus]|uniref:class I SAM-dependent methyltransferase n=1 Tax=Aspergillus undulatus TaxID=1810928 RepID=UPI003CCDCB88
MAGADTSRFNNEALNWDKNPSVQEATRLAFETLSPIIETLSERKKSRQGTGLDVLEVGCGTGLLTLRVAPLVHEIVAVDPAHGMIEVLKAKIYGGGNKSTTAWEPPTSTTDEPRRLQSNNNNGNDINIHPICTLLTNPNDLSLPSQDKTQPTGPRRKYDLILSHLVMHHVPDLHLFLSTLFNCLLPGGRVALTDFEDFGPEAIKFHPPGKLEGVERHGIKRDWIEDLMCEIGFVDVFVRTAFSLDKNVGEWEGHQVGDVMGFPYLVVEGGRPGLETGKMEKTWRLTDASKARNPHMVFPEKAESISNEFRRIVYIVLTDDENPVHTEAKRPVDLFQTWSNEVDV